jgi:hypothetical protein
MRQLNRGIKAVVRETRDHSNACTVGIQGLESCAFVLVEDEVRGGRGGGFRFPTEKIRTQFRVEVFNLFNTPNFSAPSVAAIASFGAATNVAGATADLQNLKGPTSLKLGAITALNKNYNSRQIQFAMKVLF